MTDSGEMLHVSPRRVLLFRGLALLTGLLFLGAGLTAALAGWGIGSGGTGDAHAEADRWFIAVSGTADTIFAGSLLALAWRPQLPLLFFFNVAAFVVAAVINLPVDPRFAAILAVVLPSLLAFPYWSQLRTAPSWWRRPHALILCVSAVATLVVLAVAVMAVSRQIGGTDTAARANWWADYAEHVSVLALAGLIASSGRPGWRILGALAAAGWVNLGLLAALPLSDHTGSWGVLGGLLGTAVGVVLAVGSTRGDAAGWSLRRHGPQVAASG